MSHETLITNAQIVTVDPDFSITNSLLIRDKIIRAIGSQNEVEKKASNDAVILDLGGRSVVPGFIDTHGHIALFGLDELKVQLQGATNKADICEKIASKVSKVTDGEWIVCTPVGEPPYFLNAPELLRKGAVPERKDLDRIAPNNPVYIQAPTNRVPNYAVLNSFALGLAGITGDTDVSPHSRVVKDADGSPNGRIEGAVQPLYNSDPLYQMIENVAPRPTFDDVREGIASLAPKFLAGGTTTLLEAHLTDPEELRAYIDLQQSGRLPLRIFYTFEIDSNESLDNIRDFLKTIRFAAGEGFGTGSIMVSGVSIGLDGPYWHGAAVNDAPYPGPFGELVDPKPLVDPEHYQDIMMLAAEMGFRIHAEAAGRGSIDLALRAFGRINQKESICNARHVIEHVEFPTKKQIAECRKFGLAPTTSTNFIWGKGAEVYKERLGLDYAENAIPLRDWLDGNVPVAQSTDWGPRGALFTLWQSMARQAGLTQEMIGPEQVITREEALRLFTINGAWALKQEDHLGSIEIGKRADLVVLDGDPVACDLDILRDMNVSATFIDGQMVAGQL
jgi:predicted amidohydrolase YtcJ